MRVIAGKYRSRHLRTLPGLDLRPTSDRLRETLFNVLTAGNPSALEGTLWIDLFAGTGAVGIEAISRGASVVHFVEMAKPAAMLVASNLQRLGITEGFKIIQSDAEAALRILAKNDTRADIVFMDPPYRMSDSYAHILHALGDNGLLKPSAIVVSEHTKHFDPPNECPPLVRYRQLTQGDSVLSFYRNL